MTNIFQRGGPTPNQTTCGVGDPVGIQGIQVHRGGYLQSSIVVIVVDLISAARLRGTLKLDETGADEEIKERHLGYI